MDKIDVLVIILLSISIGAFFINNAWGADYFTSMDFGDGAWYFKTDPIVCFNRPSNATEVFNYVSKHEMINAVDEWEEKLGKGFNIDIYLPRTQEQYERCNVHIQFVNAIRHDLGENVVVNGLADCKNENCMIWISIEAMRTSVINNVHGTIKHEFGHAIGLSHRYFDSVYDMSRIVIDNDVMFFQNGKFRWITDEDIRIVKMIYGDNGWREPNFNIGKVIISVVSK